MGLMADGCGANYGIESWARNSRGQVVDYHIYYSYALLCGTLSALIVLYGLKITNEAFRVFRKTRFRHWFFSVYMQYICVLLALCLLSTWTSTFIIDLLPFVARQVSVCHCRFITYPESMVTLALGLIAVSLSTSRFIIVIRGSKQRVRANPKTIHVVCALLILISFAFTTAFFFETKPLAFQFNLNNRSLLLEDDHDSNRYLIPCHRELENIVLPREIVSPLIFTMTMFISILISLTTYLFAKLSVTYNQPPPTMSSSSSSGPKSVKAVMIAFPIWNHMIGLVLGICIVIVEIYVAKHKRQKPYFNLATIVVHRSIFMFAHIAMIVWFRVMTLTCKAFRREIGWRSNRPSVEAFSRSTLSYSYNNKSQTKPEHQHQQHQHHQHQQPNQIYTTNNARRQ